MCSKKDKMSVHSMMLKPAELIQTTKAKITTFSAVQAQKITRGLTFRS